MMPVPALLRALVVACALATARASGLRVLLLTGGCWHNYTTQAGSLRAAFGRAGVAASWTVASLPCRAETGELSLLRGPGWAGGHDVVLFNGCYGAGRPGYVRGIVDDFARGVPLVAMHCAAHSFADAAPPAVAAWHALLGVVSTRHERQARYPVRVVARNSPLMRPIANAPAPFVMPRDELYVVDSVARSAHVLAYARSTKDGQEHPVFWTNLYNGRTRVFGTSFGHSDESLADHRFADTVVRGALWASGRLVDNTWYTRWR